MLPHERSLIVSRICSGYVRIKIDGKVYKLYSPNKDVLYEAEEVYTETYNLARSENVLDESNIYDILCDMKKWDDKLEIKLNETVPKYIENAKIELFENFNDREKRETIRKYLRRSEEELSRLFEIRHSFDHFGRLGTASFAKTQFLISACLSEYCNPNQILSALNENFISELQMRNVVLNEPWRSTWHSRKFDSLFGKLVSEYSEEQRRCVSWSLLFDSIFQDPELPSMQIIEDADACDGYLLKRKHKQEVEQVKNEYEERLSKHKGASDVFIPISPEEIVKASVLNGPTEKLIIANRLALINKLGKVSDEQFSDVKIGLEMARNNAGR